MTNRTILPSSKIIGKHVSNTWSEDLGKIEDVVLDINSGRIVYAVLSFRGLMGFGAKHFAIPWEKIGLPREGDASETYSLNIDREDLLHAPGFEPDKWPDMADSAWIAEMERHYSEAAKEPH